MNGPWLTWFCALLALPTLWLLADGIRRGRALKRRRERFERLSGVDRQLFVALDHERRGR